MIEDEKIIEMFFERSEHFIEDLLQKGSSQTKQHLHDCYGRNRSLHSRPEHSGSRGIHMNSKKFSEAISEVDGKYYEEAINYRKKANKPVWIKWGAVAACLCLVTISAVVLLQQASLSPDSGAGDSGGTGGAAGSYSVAVYPVTENEENVDSAEVLNLTEMETLNHPLAEHLPSQLPKGFHFGRGSIYNTVMKDKTQYHMLRIEYISGTIPEQKVTEDGGAIVPDMNLIGDVFVVCVMSYRPATDRGIYASKEEVTLSLLEENGAAYIQVGECYAGVFTETADPATVLEALKNIE